VHDFKSFIWDTSLVQFISCIFIDCIVPNSIKSVCKDCKFINTLQNFSLEEFLTFDTINSKVLLSDQMIDDYSGNLTAKNGVSISKYLAPFLSQIAANVKISRISDNYNLEHYKYFNLYAQSIETKDESIVPLSNTQKIINRIKLIKQLIDTDESVKQGYAKIQKYIDKHTEITKTIISKVNDTQVAMGLPMVYDDSFNYKGLDLSFLNLSGKIINIDPLKYDSFCCTNLNGAKFIYNYFCSTYFIGATMINTDFGSGKFCTMDNHHPNFTGATINDTTLSSILPEYRDEVLEAKNKKF
jgi:hypothetical protein